MSIILNRCSVDIKTWFKITEKENNSQLLDCFYVFALIDYFSTRALNLNFYHLINRLLINLSIYGEMGWLKGKQIFKHYLKTKEHFYFFCG